MNLLKRYIIWLRRMPHSRGFGVQSPSAYRFIRYVLCEHYPYYAYEELRREYPALTWLERKRMELYFRLANFRQASRFLSNGTDNLLLAAYVERGCRHTRVATDTSGTAEIARVCPVKGCEAWLEDIIVNATHDTVVIVEDIAENAVARCMWQRLTENRKVSVSYNLYWAGVAFFDTERFKANYIVNF